MSAYHGGCHTTDPTHWHGRTTELWAQDGWRMRQQGEHMIREAVMVKIRTEWLPQPCGLLPQAGLRDENCIGCAHDKGEGE